MTFSVAMPNYSVLCSETDSNPNSFCLRKYLRSRIIVCVYLRVGGRMWHVASSTVRRALFNQKVQMGHRYSA